MTPLGRATVVELPPRNTKEALADVEEKERTVLEKRLSKLKGGKSMWLLPRQILLLPPPNLLGTCKRNSFQCGHQCFTFWQNSFLSLVQSIYLSKNRTPLIDQDYFYKWMEDVET
jgi:hypothetical protein